MRQKPGRDGGHERAGGNADWTRSIGGDRYRFEPRVRAPGIRLVMLLLEPSLVTQWKKTDIKKGRNCYETFLSNSFTARFSDSPKCIYRFARFYVWIIRADVKRHDVTRCTSSPAAGKLAAASGGFEFAGSGRKPRIFFSAIVSFHSLVLVCLSNVAELAKEKEEKKKEKPG